MCLIQGVCLIITIFLYMYSHLGFVIAIFKPKFYSHIFFFLFRCSHWCSSHTSCNSVCGGDSHRKCHVLYITWWQLMFTSRVQCLGANNTFPHLLNLPNCPLNWGVGSHEQVLGDLRKSYPGSAFTVLWPSLTLPRYLCNDCIYCWIFEGF